ncbi:hypothetical protein UY3_07966 [Chelonia mydas]|uniref:Uncharacterized protein n=1 Tax=Chelonia mydas TaxID=8469 RepID=M7C3B6_CHEMY|nr:hypothetical protein UY3_07966 [Chelonia mydas]
MPSQGFKPSSSCTKSMPTGDPHDSCLGEAHQSDKCKICKAFKPRTRKEEYSMETTSHGVCPPSAAGPSSKRLGVEHSFGGAVRSTEKGLSTLTQGPLVFRAPEAVPSAPLPLTSCPQKTG